MSKKILVVYASTAKSTESVAIKVAEVLKTKGNQVDLRKVSEVKDVNPYEMVVFGSAIHAGRLLPNSLAFLKKHLEALKQKPFHAFIVCLAMKDDSEEVRKLVSAYLEPVRALITPVSEGFFAGVMDYKKLNFITRMIIKSMKAPEGDFRKWEEIEDWAMQIN